MPYYFPHQTFSNLRTCSEHDHYTPNAFYVFRKSHASNFSKKVTIYFVIFNVETVAIHLLLHSKQKVAKAGPPLFSWQVLTFQLKKLSQSEVSSSFQGWLLPIPFITSELQKDHNAIAKVARLSENNTYENNSIVFKSLPKETRQGKVMSSLKKQ